MRAAKSWDEENIPHARCSFIPAPAAIWQTRRAFLPLRWNSIFRWTRTASPTVSRSSDLIWGSAGSVTAPMCAKRAVPWWRQSGQEKLPRAVMTLMFLCTRRQNSERRGNHETGSDFCRSAGATGATASCPGGRPLRLCGCRGETGAGAWCCAGLDRG